jgi:hypothetical protein
MGNPELSSAVDKRNDIFYLMCVNYAKTTPGAGLIIYIYIYIYIYIHTYIYRIYTKNGAVSKVNKNLFLNLHGHNIHCQMRKLSKFLMYSLETSNVCTLGHTVIKLIPDPV